MILTTTPTLEGHPIREYRGVVTGETIIGANAIKDFMAGMRDFFGGRSKSYDYETVGQSGSMLMVTCSGTGVVL